MLHSDNYKICGTTRS